MGPFMDHIQIEADSERRSKIGARRIKVVGTGLGFAVAFCCAGLLWQQHGRGIENTERELLNVAVVLGGQLDRSLQSIDLVLSSVIERLADDGVTTADELERTSLGKNTHSYLQD